jgi:hypothetical protein
MLDSTSLHHRAFTISVGVGFIGFGFLSIVKIGDMAGLLVGLFLFVVGAAVLALPVAGMLVDLLSRQVSELFFSDNRLRGPQPIYSIPEAHRRRGDFQGAWDALEKITEEFPQELKAYAEMIDMAVLNLSDLNLAAEIMEKGMHALKRKGDREALQFAHALALDRLRSREEKSAGLQSLDGS